MFGFFIWVGLEAFWPDFDPYRPIPAKINQFRPKTLKYPYEAWMKFGNLLGLINSYIILGLVFFIILQPIAFIMKLFSYDPLHRKKNPKNKTYREIKHNKQIDLTQIF